jgi:hypothetical protein
MKIKKLKLEGNEKIKFLININFNDVTITLLEGGNPTKFTNTINFNLDDNGDGLKYVDIIANTCKKLYLQYLSGKKIQNEILETLDNKIYITIDVFVPEFKN